MTPLTFYQFDSNDSGGIFNKNTLFIRDLQTSVYGGKDLNAIVKKFFTDNNYNTYNIFFIITQYQKASESFQKFIDDHKFECILNFKNEKTSNELYLYEAQFNRNDIMK